MNKKLKSFLCLLLCLSFCLSFAACKRGGEKETTGAALDEKVTYTVRVLNQADAALENVGVYIYEDSTLAELVWYDATNEAGEIRFEEKPSDSYVAVLAEVPTGYAVDEYYPLSGLETEIRLSAGTMTDDQEITYKLGDMMMDFTVTATDGQEYSLFGLLKDKQAVVLNFYYNGCVPCKLEFPYLQEAYEEYADKIAVLAMNPIDDAEAVAQFQKEMELSFLMASCDPKWEQIMQLTAYPTTVVVDRFGNIVLIHQGGIDSAQTFKDVFAAVTGDEYEQKIYNNITEIETTAEEGSAENPTFMGATSKFELVIEGGKEHYIEFLKLNNLTMQIKDPDAYVIYNGEKYTPKNGVVSLIVTCPDMNTPVKIGFGNSSDKTKTFTVTMASQPGTLDNPYSLVLGENKVKIKAGNEQGVYYIWTAKENGTLKVWCTGATSGVEYDCVLYNLNSYAQRSLNGEGSKDENGNRCVEVKVNKGDRVQMIAAVLPDESWNYPAGNFTYQVQFTAGEGRDEDKVEKTTYTVTVTDEAGNPIANVNLHTLVDQKATPFATNAEGIAKIELPTDTYKISLIIPEGYTTEITEFELSKEAPSYTLKLTKKVIVIVDYTVTVVDANGEPVANATVIVGDKFANSDAEGKAVFNLEEGQYAVKISAPEGYLAAEDSYSFPENETALTVTLDYAPGTVNSPIPVYALETVTDPIPAGKTVYYDLFRLSGMIMTIYDADAQVTIDDQTYTADETGKLVLTVPASGSPMMPVTMQLTNVGAETEAYTMLMTYPLGHAMNPQILETLGELTTDLAEGDEDGYYYRWSAVEEGVVTFYVASATEGVVYDISLTNNTNSVNRTLSVDGVDGFVTLNVAAGDTVSIQVLTSAFDAEDNYVGNKAAQIVSVGSFTAQENTTDTKLTYSVVVKDGAGVPMENVAVTIGNTRLTTDENGMAFAQLVEGTYIAVVTAPEGYYLSNNQFTLTPEATQEEVILDAVVFVDYTVNISYEGAAYTGQVTVQILEGSSVVEENTVTTGTVATSLPAGSYTVKIVLADGTLTYDKNVAVLSADAPTANIVLTKLKTYTDYKVTVVDDNDETQSGILVQIMNGSTVAATGNTDSNGQFTANLETGNYTVELKFSGSSYYYNKQTAVLSGNAATLTIRLASELDTTKYETHWLVNDEKIYKVSEGITHVQIGAGKPYAHAGSDYTDCLFLFMPSKLGMYTITVDYKGGEVRTYSDFGGHVMDQTSNYEDGIFYLDYKYQSQLDNNIPVIFGIENVEGITDACITIIRIGDAGFDMDNLPVNTDWYSGYVPVKQSTPSGTVKYIDIKASTATYEIFYDETDKVYKVMVDGEAKSLYMNMGTVSTRNISLDMVINGDGIAGGSALRKYIYDSNGNIIAKEEYTELTNQYINAADDRLGLYPVTKDLAYIVQNAKPGWWDVTSPDYLLTDCNPELGWLFACCYIQ